MEDRPKTRDEQDDGTQSQRREAVPSFADAWRLKLQQTERSRAPEIKADHLHNQDSSQNTVPEEQLPEVSPPHQTLDGELRIDHSDDDASYRGSTHEPKAAPSNTPNRQYDSSRINLHRVDMQQDESRSSEEQHDLERLRRKIENQKATLERLHNDAEIRQNYKNGTTSPIGELLQDRKESYSSRKAETSPGPDSHTNNELASESGSRNSSEVLQEVKTAAEHNEPIEYSFERRHEIKGDTGNGTQVVRHDAITAPSEPHRAPLAAPVPHTDHTMSSLRTIAENYPLLLQDELYRSAIRYGFIGAVCIIVFAALIMVLF